MSQDNVEIVRAAYTAWNSGDMRKGKLFGLEYFWDPAEALDAVGLSE